MEFTKGQKVYVSSSDERHRGYNATITSIGSKYITTTDEYGCKQKFDKERHYCIDWSIYHLEESEESYKARLVREEKMRFNQTSGTNTIIELNECIDNFKDFEEVIVTIRKK